MADETDSRSASFALKRAHFDNSHPENDGNSSQPISKHRTHRADVNVPNVEEFVPTREIYTIHAGSPNDEHSRGVDLPPPDSHTTNFGQSMNWNTGTKAKIRVSLRDRPSKSHAASSQQVVQHRHAAEVKPNSTPHSREASAGEDHRQFECRAPIKTCRLYLGNVAYATTEETLRDVFKAYEIEDIAIPLNPRTSRSAGYAFVELSSMDEASEAIQALDGELVDGRKISVQLARDDNGKKTSGQSSHKPSNPSDNISSRTGKESAPKQSTDETVVFSTSNNIETVPANLDYGLQPTGSRLDDHRKMVQRARMSDNPVHESGSDLEAKDEMLINVSENDEQESGEVTDTSPASAGSNDHVRAAMDGAYSEDESASDTGESVIEDTDAMMNYASSNAPLMDSGYRYRPPSADTYPSNPQILAELDQHDLKLQLRYFYVAKAPTEVDFNDPVRCLTCARKGHMAVECDRRNCGRCGERNSHSAWNCPLILTAPCSKCRRPDHSAATCPSRTKLPTAAVLCEFCERSGHSVVDCELRWRTSGRPWESDLRDRRIRFECYECGKPGHLGNDCPTRQPGKPKGSSSWSYPHSARQPVDSKQGFSIKGKAQQQSNQPILIDDSEDEEANFHRPKVSAPSRQAQIKIMTGKSERNPRQFSDKFRRSDRFGNPNQRYSERRRSASPRWVEHHDPERYRYDVEPKGYSQAPTDADYGYSGIYQPPPLPREPLPNRRASPSFPAEYRKSKPGDTYRPMASSARQAWRQFRT
ncbi:MAG: hypothetical protein Q9219_003161 [cf. Caloplaca sp. 3 TL-2023]